MACPQQHVYIYILYNIYIYIYIVLYKYIVYMCVLYIYIYLIRVYNHSFSFWPSPSQFFMETYQAYMGSVPIWAGEFSEGFPFYGYPSLSSGSSATEILVPKKITDVLWKWGKYDFENGSFGIHMADMSSLVHYSGPKISGLTKVMAIQWGKWLCH
jgi:hypothetical protein